MNLKRRILPMILTILMFLTLLPASVGYADEILDKLRTTATLNIIKEGGSSTFALYKLFDMTVAEGADAFTYKASPAFTDFFSKNNAPTVKQISTYNTDQLKAFIDSIQKEIHKIDKKIDPSAIETANQVGNTNSYRATFSNLPIGYYLVIETATTGARIASEDFLVSVPKGTTDSGTGAVSWCYDVTILCKDSSVKFDKTIVNKEGDDVDSITQKIGGIINYRLDADIPQYDPQYKSQDNPSNDHIKFYITDTMSKGLSFQEDSVVIKSGVQTLSKGSDYSLNISNNKDDDTTTVVIDFKYKKIQNLTKITVAYSAVLNKDAVIGTAGNINDAYLTYTNNPSTETEYKTDEIKTKVYTTGLAIRKSDVAATDKNLAGATFELKNANNEVLTVYSYDETGKIRIQAPNNNISLETYKDGMTYFLGLDVGTYTITEKKAPSGYSLLKPSITVVISALKNDSNNYSGDFRYIIDNKPEATASYKIYNDTLINFTVFDDKGFTLPGTGGIGTTIFTVAGIFIIGIGCTLLVLFIKKNKETEKASNEVRLNNR